MTRAELDAMSPTKVLLIAAGLFARDVLFVGLCFAGLVWLMAALGAS